MGYLDLCQRYTAYAMQESHESSICVFQIIEIIYMLSSQLIQISNLYFFYYDP